MNVVLIRTVFYEVREQNYFRPVTTSSLTVALHVFRRDCKWNPLKRDVFQTFLHVESNTVNIKWKYTYMTALSCHTQYCIYRIICIKYSNRNFNPTNLYENVQFIYGECTNNILKHPIFNSTPILFLPKTYFFSFNEIENIIVPYSWLYVDVRFNYVFS